MTPDLPTTVGACIRHWAAERPDHPALRWPGGQLTYGQLHERTSRLAQALQEAGVGAGDRVAYLDKNSPEQLEIWFATAKLGAVPCPVNYRLAPPEVSFIVSDSQAKFFAVGAEFVPAVGKIEADLPGV
jgi:long-chain acyl-CoA synthetase